MKSEHPVSEFKNPFTPTFGCVPPELAGRTTLIGDVLDGLDNGPGDPNRATIFIGARGTGKTVLLATIAEQAEERGWISVNVSDRAGMLSEILVQLRKKGQHLLAPETLSWLSELHVHGVGLTRTKKEKPSTWRSDMTDAIQELNDKGAGLLITVDEASAASEELSVLVDSFQHFIRERRDVALLMAGHPHNVALLVDDDHTSFLRRAFKHTMDEIPFNDVAYAIKNTVVGAGRTIDADALSEAADAAQGYAFLIQLIGYHAWRQSPSEAAIALQDVKQGIAFAYNDMERMVLEPTVRNLSGREREFLEAMLADASESRIADVAARMHVTENNAVKIRARLVEQEIVGSRGKGRIGFDLPMLRKYLEEKQA